MSKADIVFRTDASVDIGTGHAMRCLTLADRLAATGGRCVFLSRAMPQGLRDRLHINGHALVDLPAAPPGCDGLRYSPWLGTTMDDDATAAGPIIAQLKPDWLVIDHYALDARWTEKAKGTASVLVIDDLADRRQDCDLLIDSTLGRRPGDYDSLLPPATPRLIGPNFSLLRPEFATFRPASLGRTRQPVRHVLVSMGGVDAANATGAYLDCLSGAGFHVTAVVGSACPHIATLTRQVAGMPDVDLIVDPPDMAALMAGADLCIGAAGTTAWERCALGLPTLMVVLAENQRLVAQGVERAGASRTIHAGTGRADLLGLIAEIDVSALSAAAAAVTDGRGAERTVATMRALPRLRLRRATMDDAPAIWTWRTAGDAARYYTASAPVPLADHMDWFATALHSEGRRLFVVEADGLPAVHLRIDTGATHARVSVTANPARRGQRLVPSALALALAECADLGRFDAVVHQDNLPSRMLFEGTGFEFADQDGAFRRYIYAWRD